MKCRTLQMPGAARQRIDAHHLLRQVQSANGLMVCVVQPTRRQKQVGV
jgi:hypothetical protein